MRHCRYCDEVKSLSEFYPRKRTRDGYGHKCKRCEIETGNAWRRNNRDRVNASARARGPRDTEQTRRQRLWTWYRITPDQFNAILAHQEGACAICRTTEPGGRGEWHVDHDHACCSGSRSCGACVRGLLCSRCNPMLGMARDDIDVLRAAVQYLDYNAALSALGAIGG